MNSLYHLYISDNNTTIEKKEKLIKKTVKRLEKLGVVIMNEVSITEVQENFVCIKDKEV